MNKHYTQSVDEVLQSLDATAEGLSTAEAEKRLETYGPNKLKEAPKPTILQPHYGSRWCQSGCCQRLHYLRGALRCHQVHRYRGSYRKCFCRFHDDRINGG